MAEAPAESGVLLCGEGPAHPGGEFSTEQLLETLPGFISHSKVLAAGAGPGLLCPWRLWEAPRLPARWKPFAPWVWRNSCSLAFAGVFGGRNSGGDVLLPEKIWSEEGRPGTMCRIQVLQK